MAEGMRERDRMKQVGEFWLPDIDLRWWGHWGKTRRKARARYGQGGPKTGDIEAALAHISRCGHANPVRQPQCFCPVFRRMMPAGCLGLFRLLGHGPPLSRSLSFNRVSAGDG